jgi:hypothetical protein
MRQDAQHDDPLAPIPDLPGQDPDAAEPGPWTDGFGLSDTPDSGYDIDRSKDGRATSGSRPAEDDDDSEDLEHGSPT